MEAEGRDRAEIADQIGLALIVKRETETGVCDRAHGQRKMRRLMVLVNRAHRLMNELVAAERKQHPARTR